MKNTLEKLLKKAMELSEKNIPGKDNQYTMALSLILRTAEEVDDIEVKEWFKSKSSTIAIPTYEMKIANDSDISITWNEDRKRVESIPTRDFRELNIPSEFNGDGKTSAVSLEFDNEEEGFRWLETMKRILEDSIRRNKNKLEQENDRK